MGRIGWLDGWRAVAVILVIASHIPVAYGWENVAIPGKLGVYIFFAISGYIITKLLVNERARTGAVDLRHFYLRRALRILPPLFLYVAVCVAIYWPAPAVQAGALRSVAFTCNMDFDAGDCGWVFGHTWSLAFEEQFYLLLPFFLIGVRSLGRAALLVMVLAIAAIPFVLPVQFIGRIGFIQIYMLLGMGALYARHEQAVAPYLHRLPAIISLAGLVLAGLWVGLAPSTTQVITGLFVAPAIFLAVFALPARSRMFRALLSAYPLRMIGLFSYTLYLWQQIALTRAAWNTGWMPVIGLAAAAIFSAISYYTIEAFMRRLATRLGKPVAA